VGVTCSKHYEINLQEAVRLLRFALPSAGRKGGLRRTIEGFGLEFEGTPHNALVDARNTLMLANRILRDFGMGRAVYEHMKVG
jgi:inhibitor of KinA sporulation pathway (predicted exonuclease)